MKQIAIVHVATTGLPALVAADTPTKRRFLEFSTLKPASPNRTHVA